MFWKHNAITREIFSDLYYRETIRWFAIFSVVKTGYQRFQIDFRQTKDSTAWVDAPRDRILPWLHLYDHHWMCFVEHFHHKLTWYRYDVINLFTLNRWNFLNFSNHVDINYWHYLSKDNSEVSRCPIIDKKSITAHLFRLKFYYTSRFDWCQA